MTATLALLAATFVASPGALPDGKTLDALSYTFGGGPFGPSGTLSIAADGKVSYNFSSAPSTGSGGRVVKMEWAFTKEQKAELFGKLVEAGLLEMPGGPSVPFSNGFVVSSGKWRLSLSSVKVPDKVMALLRPLLAKAHPELWAENPEPKPSKPERLKLSSLGYTYTPKANGEIVSLHLQPNDTVRYTRRCVPNAPAGPLYVVEKDWKLTTKEMETLFESLVSDGLCELEDSGGGYPKHSFSAYAGRWSATFNPKELPDKVSSHLLPLLKKADAEFWK